MMRSFRRFLLLFIFISPCCRIEAAKNIRCRAPNIIAHGSVKTSDGTYKVGTIITYTCNNGFQLLGSTQRTCQNDGTWSGDEPRCEARDECHRRLNRRCHEHAHCKKIDENYKCVCNTAFQGDGYQCLREDECHKQFHQGCHEHAYCRRISEGKHKCICNEGYSGDGFHCRSIECQKPGEIGNGKIHPLKAKYIPGNSISYQCNHKFVLVGDSQRTCLRNGQWSGCEPRCTAGKTVKTCQKPPEIPHGTITPKLKRYRTNSMISYKCIKGYRLTGNSQRTCLNIGFWSGCEPRCEKIPEDVCKSCHKHADCQRLSGGRSECRCREGYTGDGKTCQAQGCQRPGDPANGKLLTTQRRFVRGNVITYQCDHGYKLEGTSQRSCLADGRWTGNEPRCEGIPKRPGQTKCTRPRNIQNGNIISNDGTYKAGTVITYQCGHSYRLVGDSQRTCQDNGHWSGGDPQCKGPPKKRSCQRPTDIANGKITASNQQYRINTMITYKCKRGYQLRGPSQRNCNNDGNWTGSQPRCERLRKRTKPR